MAASQDIQEVTFTALLQQVVMSVGSVATLKRAVWQLLDIDGASDTTFGCPPHYLTTRQQAP